jgi:hypothetical protein
LVKSAFAIDKNRFSHNLYWRRDGKLRFEVQDKQYGSLADFEGLVKGDKELAADPKLAFTPDACLCRDDSPARGAGLALPDVGPHDFFKAPLKQPLTLGYAQASSFPVRPPEPNPSPSNP